MKTSFYASLFPEIDHLFEKEIGYFNKAISQDFAFKDTGRQFSLPMWKRAFSFYPFNLRRDPDGTLVIEIALAGFKKNEVVVSLEEGLIRIRATKAAVQKDGELPVFIWNGLSQRPIDCSIASNSREQDIENTRVEFVEGVLSISIPSKKLNVPKKVLFSSSL